MHQVESELARLTEAQVKQQVRRFKIAWYHRNHFVRLIPELEQHQEMHRDKNLEAGMACSEIQRIGRVRTEDERKAVSAFVFAHLHQDWQEREVSEETKALFEYWAGEVNYHLACVEACDVFISNAKAAIWLSESSELRMNVYLTDDTEQPTPLPTLPPPKTKRSYEPPFIIVTKQDAIKNILHKHIAPEQHQLFADVLNSKSIEGRIWIKEKTNRIVDVFKRILIEDNNPTSKDQLAVWLAQYFDYGRTVRKPISKDSARDILKRAPLLRAKQLR